MTKSAIEHIESFGYAVVSREVFMGIDNLLNNGASEADQIAGTEGLKRRAAEFEGAFVLYDPSDDDAGLLLVGDDAEALASEAMELID